MEKVVEDIKIKDSNEPLSKETRLDIQSNLSNLRFDSNIFVHVFRYLKVIENIIKCSNRLKRPVTILDVGCGEIYIPTRFVPNIWIAKSAAELKSILLDKYNEQSRKLQDWLDNTPEIELERKGLLFYDDGCSFVTPLPFREKIKGISREESIPVISDGGTNIRKDILWSVS